MLFQSCTPEAAHDAGAREYAPRCHPGTRQNYIDQIVQWTLEPKQRQMLWMKGPAGVGKTAVAQSCAEMLSNLGAAFFFSRPNKVTDPKRFFPSIAYQLALKHDAYRKILNRKIGKDPSLLTKSLEQQFYNLFVIPLQKLKVLGSEFEEKTIIVDGFDECEGHDSQCSILQTVLRSVRERTTPFLWAFFSRPEAHLVSLLGSPTIQPFSLYMELPVSSDSDKEISTFLSDELRKVQLAHGLSPSWPTPDAIATIVRFSAGLFIYSSTVVRFICDPNSFGPVTQLDAVLSLEHGASPTLNGTTHHPLSELDSFYTLIMRKVPPKTLAVVQEIILLLSWHQGRKDATVRVSNLLRLSTAQMAAVLRPLYSVLSVQDGFLMEITFYHASFLEFLSDLTRSRDFCLDRCKPGLWKKMLTSLEGYSTGGLSNNLSGFRSVAYSRSQGIGRPRSSSIRDEEIAKTWLRLLGSMPLDHDTLQVLREFNFRIFTSFRGFELNFNAGGLFESVRRSYFVEI